MTDHVQIDRLEKGNLTEDLILAREECQLLHHSLTTSLATTTTTDGVFGIYLANTRLCSFLPPLFKFPSAQVHNLTTGIAQHGDRTPCQVPTGDSTGEQPHKIFVHPLSFSSLDVIKSTECIRQPSGKQDGSRTSDFSRSLQTMARILGTPILPVPLDSLNRLEANLGKSSIKVDSTRR